MRTRPVFLQKDERIKAHFLVCFLSLLSYRLIEKKLNESATCSEIIQTLREMRVLEYADEGYVPAYTRTDVTDILAVFTVKDEIIILYDISHLNNHFSPIDSKMFFILL
ncbi:hypothetical protein ACFSTH_18625 [Paenibacillus yanchengensis]|uniref:Transposase n=1 Tax=Paenibacillus yanchengensis TaxID=2035833 RepID=A0ABW4YLX9_9BACL